MGKRNEKVEVSPEILHEEEEMALFRIAEENAKYMNEPLGIHRAFTTKGKKKPWGINGNVKVERVQKFYANTSSPEWKRYLAKEITFQQFCQITKIKS